MPRGTHCGPDVSWSTTSACLPGSSEPIRSAMPIASAPADVSSASPSAAVIDVGSTDRSRSRPTNSAAARSGVDGVGRVLGVAAEGEPPASPPQLDVPAARW